MMVARKKVICVDFDGVIYKNLDYKGTTVLTEPPVDGSIEALKELSTEYTVVINSARCETDEGMGAVQRWLDKYNLPYKLYKHKPHAFIYIDDRAVPFNGDWGQTISDVKQFKQWQAKLKMLMKKRRRRLSIALKRGRWC